MRQRLLLIFFLVLVCKTASDAQQSADFSDSVFVDKTNASVQSQPTSSDPSASAHQKKEGTTIALLLLSGDLTHHQLRLFSEAVRDEMKQVPSWKVIPFERLETQLASPERMWSESCTSEACRAEVGRIASADAVVTGSLVRYDERSTLVLVWSAPQTGRTLRRIEVSEVGSVNSTVGGGLAHQGIRQLKRELGIPAAPITTRFEKPFGRKKR